MKYRVVQLSDGRFACQWRFAFIWWANSAYSANDIESAIRFTKAQTPAKVVKVVWP